MLFQSLNRIFCIKSSHILSFKHKFMIKRPIESEFRRFFYISSVKCQGQGPTRTRFATSDPKSKRSTLYYLTAIGVLVAGLSYAAVPLYRIFCKSYSYGGTIGGSTHPDESADLSKLKKFTNRPIKITFNADRSSSLLWNFRPEQLDITVYPGETALAFYRAENKTERAVDGISTYNVLPFEAGQYFNKIQCFCFEEQRLNPGELVELPVFFYIDPEFMEDPKMLNVNEITLSYTFFEAREVPNLNIPWLNKSHGKNSTVVLEKEKSSPSPAPTSISTSNSTSSASIQPLQS